jgi:sulfur carrier protein ThiS
VALAPRQAANDEMRVRVKVYGLLIAAGEDPDRLIELSLPSGTAVAGAIEALQETSSLFDPRSCLAVIDGVRVPPDHVLRDGNEVHLYHVFSGG